MQLKASFYLCLAGGLLGLRCTSVEISRRRCSNVRCLFGTVALGGVAFAAFIWLAPNKAHHNMAGLRFNTVQRPVIIASSLLKWLSICKNEFSHVITNGPAYREHTSMSTAAAQWSSLTAFVERDQQNREALCSDVSLQPKAPTKKFFMTNTTCSKYHFKLSWYQHK